MIDHEESNIQAGNIQTLEAGNTKMQNAKQKRIVWILELFWNCSLNKEGQGHFAGTPKQINISLTFKFANQVVFFSKQTQSCLQ